jgi:signal transduction histidine kinase
MTDLVAGPTFDEPLSDEPLEPLGDRDTGRPLMTYGRDILVVDDHDSNLLAIEESLAALGRKVALARSGIEALARLLEQDFALIILDVAMPGMDGFETARLIRSRARNRTTPIIFISGLSWQDDEILKGYQLGASDFMMKPVRPEVLRAKASMFLELQERTLELTQKAEELRAAQNRAHERELTMQRERFEAEVMEHQMAQMADADRRKDEFLAILAHELRNPLQPLQTAVEVMEHEPDKPVPARVRGIIRRQVAFIGRLVDDLLDVARFQTGKLDLRREPVSLDRIVEEAIADMRVLAEARNHTLAIEPVRPAPLVDGDPVRLVQVICNLLSNAIKYTPPGGRIEVRYGSDVTHAFIRITDSGKGILAELVPRVFDMFVHERVTPDGAGGLGLGLGLVRRLIELHGGTVTASSDGLGKGATFEVRLPVYDEHAPAPPPAAADTNPALRPLKAVVCDDAVDLRELVAELLRMKGHEVFVCDDGASALRVIAAERPDVALIDIGLPEMDGYEVARRVRRDATDKRVRLIAMTGYGQAVDRQNAMQAGFDAHIVKPASAEKIMRALYGTPEDS